MAKKSTDWQKAYHMLFAAIARSGMDISDCIKCSEQVLHLMDHTPVCEKCLSSAMGKPDKEKQKGLF